MSTQLSKPVDPRGLIWHYTTWPAMQGILESGTLWASSIGYLNDASEFNHSADIVTSLIVNQFRDIVGELPRDEIVHAIRDGLKRVTEAACVISLSERFDDLSQWRAYSSSGPPPVALGFDPNEFHRHAKSLGHRFVPCVYEDSEKRKILEPLSRRINLQALQDQDWISECQRFVADVLSGFSIIGPFLKDYAFRDESEWRIVCKPPSVDSGRWGFHQSRSLVVPHCILNWLDSEGHVAGLTEILVGPHPHLDKVMGAVSKLISVNESRFKSPAVRRTSIPYRNW